MVHDGPYPVYGANGVIGRYHSFNHEESEVLLGCRGSCGSVNVSQPQSWVTGNAMIIKPRDARLSKEFLRYFLDGSEEIAKTITGVAQPQITQKSLAPISIPVPSLQDQRRIVAVLDEAFAAIAITTANAEKNIANTRSIVETEVRSLFEVRGEGWSEFKLPEISTNLDSQRKPVTKSDRIPGDVPYYGASGQVDCVRDHLFDEDLLLISEDGANLLARTYPIAFSISGKSWVNNHAHILRFDHPATQRLVEYYLNSISLAPWITGMAQPKLNQKALHSIPIPLPVEHERRRIAERLDALKEECESLAGCYQRTLMELSELKQSLLASAFNARLSQEREPLAA
jgi:type I restriction enzyme S subunit